MKCTQCGTEFEGNFCPNCGESAQTYKKSTKKSKNKKPIYKRAWFIILAIIVVIYAVRGASDKQRETTADKQIDSVITTYEPIEKNQQEADSNTTPEETERVDELDANGLRPEFKKAMDSYETFMDEYVEFMKSYENNPSDLQLLANYAKYMTKYAQFCDDFAEWEDEDMNDAETAYYLEVQMRVNQKLLSVVG